MEKLEEQFTEELLKYRKNIDKSLKKIEEFKEKISEEENKLQQYSKESGIPIQYILGETRYNYFPNNFFEQMNKIKDSDIQYEIFGDFVEYEPKWTNYGWQTSQIC